MDYLIDYFIGKIEILKFQSWILQLTFFSKFSLQITWTRSENCLMLNSINQPPFILNISFNLLIIRWIFIWLPLRWSFLQFLLRNSFSRQNCQHIIVNTVCFEIVNTVHTSFIFPYQWVNCAEQKKRIYLRENNVNHNFLVYAKYCKMNVEKKKKQKSDLKSGIVKNSKWMCMQLSRDCIVWSFVRIYEGLGHFWW